LLNDAKKLKSDKNIVICKADKGNATVIMNRVDYEQKIQTLLNDTCYSIVQQDPTSNLGKAVKEFCKKLIQNNEIEKTFQSSLIVTNIYCPIFYGLPKIHKKEVPLRPIVDYRNSPFYKMSIFLKNILGLLDFQSYCTKNSKEFVEQLKTTKIRPGEEMVSFDIVSLFTNVPIPETLDYIKECLSKNTIWKQKCNLSEDSIMEMLILCTNNNYFSWKNIIYKQSTGTPMGSPLSPTLANFFLHSLESTIIPRNNHIKFWSRYMDDIFSFIRSRFKEKILKELNSFHRNIQFTLECEKDNKLPFLDVMIIKMDNGTFKFDIFRKPTHTDRYLNYESFHINNHKISVIDSLVDRAFTICDEDYINNELCHIRNSLQANNYPIKTIEKRIEHIKNRRIVPNADSKPRLILPYIGNNTHKIVRMIRSSLDINFGFLTGKKLCNIVCNHKESYQIKNNGIYKIKCDSCNDCYIGETFRDFDTRLKEHLADTRHNRILTSAIALHMAENPNHKIDIKNSGIIEKEKKYWHRKYKEALYIKNHKNIMNLDKGYSINPFWNSVLHPFYKNT